MYQQETIESWYSLFLGESFTHADDLQTHLIRAGEFNEQMGNIPRDCKCC